MGKKEDDARYYIKNKIRFSIRNREYYLRNRDTIIKQEHERYLKNRNSKIEKMKKYSNTEDGRKNIRKNNSIYIKKFPLRHNARKRLLYAVKTGKIIREICQVCGESKVHGHHRDYNKPYDVIWLCQRHHKLLHQGLLEIM